MSKDKLVECSEKLSNLSLEMSEGESTLKKSVSAYLENCKIKSEARIKSLDSEFMAKCRGNGFLEWLKNLFGFGKSKKDKSVNRAVATEHAENFGCESIEESCISKEHEESVHSKMRKAGYKSLVENSSVENKFEKDKSSDIQQNQ